MSAPVPGRRLCRVIKRGAQGLDHHFNMADYAIGRAARSRPEHPALIVVTDARNERADETWSFARLEGAVLAIAAGLAAKGLGRGDRVMIRLDNTSTYALLFFGAIAGGYVPLPVSSALTGREAQFLLEDSGACLLALGHGLGVESVPSGVHVLETEEIEAMIARGRPVAQAYADTLRDDPAYLIYTSGTTAQPKGVLHAQRAALGRRPMYQGWYGIEASDRMLHAGAFNWTFTLGTGLTDPWANGATAIVYTGEKDPALWPGLISGHGATLFAAVPGVYRQILKYARPDIASLGALRHGLMAGEAPPPGLFEEWRAQTGRDIHEALGMSEISTYISTAPSVRRRPGFVGKPQLGRRVAILPEVGGDEPLPAGAQGLLGVHASDPGLMLGYWRRPQEVAEVRRGDWFVGGDLALMDGDGYVAHLGRGNDVIKALGYRVSPQEVEAALADHPAVAEVACTEVAVRDGVHVVGAFVVAKEGAAASEADILAHAAARLADYKRPRLVRFVAALPRTANGKIRRADLKA